MKRYRTDIIAERVQFGPKRQGDVGETDDGSRSADRSDQGIAVSAGPNMDSPIAEQLMDDDVPF